MKMALILSLVVNVLLLSAVYFMLSSHDNHAIQVKSKLTSPGQQSFTSSLSSASVSAPPSTSEQIAITSVDTTLDPDHQFTQLQTLANSGQWEALAPLLSEFLYQYPSHFHAQMLEARVIIHTQTSAKGLEYLYTLMSNQGDEQAVMYIQGFINDHVGPIIDALRDNQDWTALATFLEPLIQYAPTATQYIEPLALSYAMLNLPDAMENTLASLPEQHPVTIQTRRLWVEKFKVTRVAQNSNNTQAGDKLTENIISTNSPADIVIPLTNRRNQWYAPLNIGSKTFELLVDTGATTTAISREAFARLAPRQKQFLGRILINTASGQTQAPLYSMKDVSMSGWKLGQIDILVLPVERLSGFDGLLGMNILNRSQVIIDQVSGALEVRL